jgi:hypothetical protein
MAPRQDAYVLPRHPARPTPAQTNSLARAALILSIMQIVMFPLGIAAIVAGTGARRQIRETGEAGYRMATAGLMLGWLGVTILLIAMIAGLGSH